MSGRCHNCGTTFDKSREAPAECPGCGAGLTDHAGVMPEDMDLAASNHFQQIARDLNGHDDDLAVDGGTTMESRFELGDRITDADESDDKQAAMRVLRRTGERADEHEIDALPGAPTVADLNEDYPRADPVLIIGFESELARQVPDWRDVPPEDLEARLDAAGETLYSYPQSRCISVPEEWEPAGDGRASSRRERDDLFGDHEQAVAAFIEDVQQLFTAPAQTADELLELLSVGPSATETVANADAVLTDLATPPLRESTVTPRATGVGQPTRGTCRYTRDDTYRPEDDGAIVCWHCSNLPHRRPEKFKRDEQAGAECEQRTPTGWTLRQRVAESADVSKLPKPLRDAYADDGWTFLDNLAALQSDDDDQIRKTALRMAYKPHLEDVEAYNYARALALLRDHGVASDLPIIGDGRREVEA